MTCFRQTARTGKGQILIPADEALDNIQGDMKPMRLRLAVAGEDTGLPLKQAIAAASSLAVEGLRLNARTEVRPEEFSESALRQLRLNMEENQLRVAGLMYSSRHSLCEEKSLERRIEGIRSAMTMVRKLNTSEVIVRVGRIPDPEDHGDKSVPQPSDADVDSLRNPFAFAPSFPTKDSDVMPSDSKQFETLCEVVNDLAAFGSRCGADLQLQVSSYVPSRIAALLARTGSGPVSVVFDPAVCVMSGSRPVSVFRDLYRSIGYIRARDAQKDVDGGGVESPLGDGSVDWDELIPTLMEAAYPGWMCVERTGGDQRSDDVRLAVKRLRNLLPPAGVSV